MTHNIIVECGTSVRLPTAGKYCDRDIIITANSGDKKYKYEVSYLESVGTQWIDTKIAASATNFRVVMDFVYTTEHIDSALFGSSVGSTWSIVPYTQPVFYVGTSAAILEQSTEINTRYVLDTQAKNGTFTVNLNGNVQTAEYTGYIENTQNVFVFAHNADGTTIQQISIKCYKVQIYNDDELVRDYIPVIDHNYRPCMYDKVTDELFYNQGTGEFLYC